MASAAATRLGSSRMQTPRWWLCLDMTAPPISPPDIWAASIPMPSNGFKPPTIFTRAGKSVCHAASHVADPAIAGLQPQTKACHQDTRLERGGGREPENADAHDRR